MTATNCYNLKNALKVLDGKIVAEVKDWHERLVFTDGTEAVLDNLPQCCSEGGVGLDFEEVLPGFTFSASATVEESEEEDGDRTESVSDGDHGSVSFTHFSGDCPGNDEFVILVVS